MVPVPDEPKPAAPAPAAVAPTVTAPMPPPEKAEPPRAPLEVKIPARQITVKLVSSGAGKKQAMRYGLKAGAKQSIELAMDFTGKQDTEERVVPTIVLIGNAETTAVDKDGNADLTVTVTRTDARTVPGSQIPLEQFKGVVGELSGLTIGGKLGTTGTASELTMRLASAPQGLIEAMQLIRLTLPTLPVLPKEAIGVGARWQATSAGKLAERLDVTQVTDYELVAHQGTTWKIVGTTKITGKDQEIDSNKITGIAGTGTSETTITDGALLPSHKSLLETQFKAVEADHATVVTFKIGSAVTPKAP